MALEVLEFIFQDFIHWSGTVIILWSVFKGINITINKGDKE